MAPKVLIVDYGANNLNSIRRSLDRIGSDSVVSSHPVEIANADKIVLPGVGHFGRAMSRLKSLNLIDALNEAVLEKRKPILGICLGMEMMAKKSEEGDADGLGWFNAEIVKFRASDKLKYKIPYIGWNRIRVRKGSSLMHKITDSNEFYFLHSYHLKLADGSDMLSETVYEFPYPSAIEKDNIFGVQYHPEKSHDAGEQVLRNFVKL